MATQTDLAAYVGWVRGHFIDVDGVFGAQCWDQWSHYATNFLGVPSWPTYTNAGGTHPHSGYACNVYHNFWRSGLSAYFDILPADATPQAGDVAFWEFGSAWYPYSHVATVLEGPTKNGMLRCLTQNPGYVQIANLIMRGVIGYLRPKTLAVGDVDASKTDTHTNSEKHQEDDLMAIYLQPTGNSSPIEAGNPGSSRIWAGDDRVIGGAKYSGVWERSEDGSLRRLFPDEWAAIQRAYAAVGRKVPLASIAANELEKMYLVKRAEPKR